jgi:hypothetical protein
VSYWKTWCDKYPIISVPFKSFLCTVLGQYWPTKYNSLTVGSVFFYLSKYAEELRE